MLVHLVSCHEDFFLLKKSERLEVDVADGGTQLGDTVLLLVVRRDVRVLLGLPVLLESTAFGRCSRRRCSRVRRRIV